MSIGTILQILQVIQMGGQVAQAAYSAVKNNEDIQTGIDNAKQNISGFNDDMKNKFVDAFNKITQLVKGGSNENN